MKTSLLLSSLILLFPIFKQQSGTNNEVGIENTKASESNKTDKENTDTSQMTLLDINNKKISLDDLLKKHRGKVVYVDFWASWCKPCRTAFPASKQLKESLKDLPVVFVYLSIDSSINPWKQACIKEKLDNYPDSYLVSAWEESPFIKKHRVSSIPRYMIFNQKGELVDTMAAGPVNEDADVVLSKLAKTR